MTTTGYTTPCCVHNHLQTASPLPFRTRKVHGTGGNRRLPLLIEADINDGVRTVDLSLYAPLHTRICRPVGLNKEKSIQSSTTRLNDWATPMTSETSSILPGISCPPLQCPSVSDDVFSPWKAVLIPTHSHGEPSRRNKKEGNLLFF